MRTRIIILAVISILSASAEAKEIYLWPMAGNRKISSTFGEYREGHYHAGIDIRCFGRVGLPCFAISGGYVKRIKVRPSGYGKALYLELDNGETAVYAHLHSFGAAIDSMIYNKMTESRENWCDLFLEDGKFRFDIGDTVAFSGRSGCKSPHLHFELRNNAGSPINPLPDIFEIDDGMPPLISALEVVPLGYGSKIDEHYSPKVLNFKIREKNSYEITDTLQLDGVFGFGLSTWDEQSVGGYKMGPFSIELSVDGRVLYRIENRIFSYGQSGEIAFEYDKYGKSWTRRFNLLFRKEGNSRSDRNGTGVICSDSSMTDCVFLKKGLHRGELFVSDSFGNEAKGKFHFILNDYPVIHTAKRLENDFEVVVSSIDPDGGRVNEELFESFNDGESWGNVPLRYIGKYAKGKVSPVSNAVYKYVVVDDEGASVSECFASPEAKSAEDMVFCECQVRRIAGGLALEIKTDKILASPPRVEIINNNGPLQIKAEQLGEKLYLALFKYGAINNGENLFNIYGRDYRGYEFNKYYAARVVLLESGREGVFRISNSLKINLESSSVKGRVPCIISSVPLSAREDSGMSMISTPFNLDFAADCFFEPIRVSGCREGNVGLFQFDADDSVWKCVGVPEMEGGSVDINESGTYAYLRDRLPPKIGDIKKAGNFSGSGFFRKYIYYLTIEDKGSGIDPYSSRVFWNGKWTVSHWDQIRDKLYIPVPAFRQEKTVSLRVEIGDRVGNVAVKDFGFVLE